jgi:hypothetical protein
MNIRLLGVRLRNAKRQTVAPFLNRCFHGYTMDIPHQRFNQNLTFRAEAAGTGLPMPVSSVFKYPLFVGGEVTRLKFLWKRRFI